MKGRKRTTVFAIPLALVAGVSFVAVSWYAQRVTAVQDSEDFPAPYGFIELVAGQTARLNLVDVQPASLGTTRTPDSNSPPEPDHVRLGFDVYVQDLESTPACGGIVPVPPICLVRYRFLRREFREVDLMPGQAASINFTAAENTRVQAFIQSLGGPDTLGNPDTLGGPDTTPEPHLIPSLEVREGARTLFVVPALAKFFNPQPDPPGQQQ
jgi:hypothetical protein